MIELYQNYLVEKLKNSGIKKVCVSMKELQASSDIVIGAVIIDKDILNDVKQNKIYYSEDKTIKRIKKLARDTYINVIIGQSNSTKCDEIFRAFLSSIDKGIYDNDNNYIDIELKEAEWVSDKDSILKSTMAVQLTIIFHGGIYKDYEFKPVQWRGDGEYVKRNEFKN